MNAMGAALMRVWHARSDREQVMLAVAGLLLLVLLVSLAAIQPLMRVNTGARDDYAAAMRLYRAIETDAAAYRQLSAVVQTGSGATQSLRAVAGSLALRHEISLARLVPSDDGALTVSIDRAPVQNVMRWLVDLDQRHGIQVMSSTMDREGEGFVSAAFELRRRGGA
jgi:general secretion pathway protein M